jgi:hypothetical protein
MRFHHTKSKGDLGLFHAMADLAEKGWGILLPMTEHEAFDLVAYRDETFLRIQVKYRAAKNGIVVAPLSTCWADRNGTHIVPIDRRSIDLMWIYCPNTKTCYYVDPKQFPTTVNLRIDPARNNQAKGVRLAKDFMAIPRDGVRIAPGLERSANVRQSSRRKRP